MSSPRVTEAHELAPLIEGLQARLEDLVADGLDAIQREVPVYSGIEDVTSSPTCASA